LSSDSNLKNRKQKKKEGVKLGTNKGVAKQWFNKDNKRFYSRIIMKKQMIYIKEWASKQKTKKEKTEERRNWKGKATGYYIWKEGENKAVKWQMLQTKYEIKEISLPRPPPPEPSGGLTKMIPHRRKRHKVPNKVSK
jgi:hypothetical protein